MKNLTVLILLSSALACTSSGVDPAVPSRDVSSPPDSDVLQYADALQDADALPDTQAPPPSIIDPSCEVAGCLRAVEALGTYSKAEIEPFLAPGVILDNGYSIFRVRYFTDGREARAIFTIPDLETPPVEGYAVAVNNPGTVGIADACAVGEGLAGVGLSGYFGGRGLFGVAVDYPGLGTDGAHPYLVLAVEGRASLDAVRAALNFSSIEDVPTSGRAIIAGLSQGGHATFAAAQEHLTYAPELDLRAFAVAGPASVFLEHWSSGATVSGPHMVFHALLVHTYAVHY
ncbi:MAG: lipase family protein, partial [Bradymonadaceae bacterium]